METIHVTNIPLEITEPEIMGLFIPFGNIVKIKPSEKFQKRFNQPEKKFNKDDTSFVEIEFEEIEDCQEAKENMNGFKIFDKYLIVTQNFNKENKSLKLSNLKDKKAIWDQDEEMKDL